jgi:hypothetical protein
MRRILLVYIVFMVAATAGFAQDNGVQQVEEVDEGIVSEQIETEPPLWARNLRRAEIVATGSFPLTLLASRLVYSLLRFTVKSIELGAIDMSYAPWFLAPPGSPELEFNERVGIVAGAAAFSSLIAFIDYRRGVAEAQPPP